MNQSSQNIKVLVLDDYEGFAAAVPTYEKVKARAQVVILRTKLKDDTELANALRECADPTPRQGTHQARRQ
jgi:hypothetical protein